MKCELGKFVGPWKVIVGYRLGEVLTLDEGASEFRYELSDTNTIYDNLDFDDVAFTLQNTTACLSLEKDFDHLFGFEWIDNEYQVWAAERLEGLPESEAEADLDPTESPDWRDGEDWDVKVVSDDVPVEEDDVVVITETTEEEHEFELHKTNDTVELIDQLNRNDSNNRTLDGANRTVAFWARDSYPDRIFAIVFLSDEAVRRIKQIKPLEIEKVREALREVGGLLSFEIEMLAKRFFSKADYDDPGVWGAEEG